MSGVLSVSGTVPTLGSINFLMSQVQNFTEITTLFDQYRIAQVVVQFSPRTFNANDLPPVFTVIDYDDSNTPSALGELREYATLLINPGGTYFERVLNPKFTTAAYSGTFTSYAVSGGWVDSASPNVEWYGIKYGIPAGATTNSNYYQIDVSYILNLRNVH